MEALGRASGRYSDVSWRTGRQRDLWLILGTAVIAGLVTAVGAMWGDTERIGAYWTSAVLDDRGQAQIVEVIDYDFGSWPRKKHGILRDIPGVEQSAEITASSPTAPDQLRVTSTSVDVRLRIGDPYTEISDRHRYRIEYPLGTLVEGDRFSWNAVGTRWLVPIDEVEAHVVAPSEFVDITCDRGRRSAVGGCTAEQIEPGHLVVRTSGLGDAEGVTVSATLGPQLQTPPVAPPPPTGPPDDPGLGVAVPALVAVGLTLVGGALAWALIRRIGRERVWAGGTVAAAFGPGRDEVVGIELLDHGQLAEMATIEFEPPEELSAAAGGVVYDEHVLSLIHISEPTRRTIPSRMPSSA